MRPTREPILALVAMALAGAVVAACGGPASHSTSVTPAPPCTTPSDCPDPGTACQTAACNDGRCGTIDAAVATTCADAGGKVCDGAGSCVECNFDAECAGTTNPCAFVRCAGHACLDGFYAGTVDVPQTPNDCQTLACDGAGGMIASFDPLDVVTVTGNPCTEVACYQAGLDPVTFGTDLTVPNLDGPCSGAGGPGYCNAYGNCVECTLASQCPASAAECQQAACNASSFTCGFVALDPTTACSAGTGHCDGAGSCVVP